MSSLLKAGSLQLHPRRAVGRSHQRPAVRGMKLGPVGRLKFSLVLIRQLIERGKRDPNIRGLFNRIMREQAISENALEAQFEAVGLWLKNRIRYQRDPDGVEAISDASDTLKNGFGDCDDLSVMAGAVLESGGFPVRVCVVGQEVPSHVYIEALVRGEWRVLDLACPVERIFQKKISDYFSRKEGGL